MYLTEVIKSLPSKRGVYYVLHVAAVHDVSLEKNGTFYIVCQGQFQNA